MDVVFFPWMTKLEDEQWGSPFPISAPNLQNGEKGMKLEGVEIRQFYNDSETADTKSSFRPYSTEADIVSRGAGKNWKHKYLQRHNVLCSQWRCWPGQGHPPTNTSVSFTSGCSHLSLVTQLFDLIHELVYFRGEHLDFLLMPIELWRHERGQLLVIGLQLQTLPLLLDLLLYLVQHWLSVDGKMWVTGQHKQDDDEVLHTSTSNKSQ